VAGHSDASVSAGQQHARLPEISSLEKNPVMRNGITGLEGAYNLLS
jgi:hypothetical protein